METPTANPNLLRIGSVYGAKFGPRLMLLARSSAKPVQPKRTRPAVVDWRNRCGSSWITEAPDQGSTQNCWAFASNGLIEATVRIGHAVWRERSVTEIRKGVGKTVNDGGNAHEALAWVNKNGLADPECTPYSTDEKKWLDAVGPLVCFFEVWTDFDDPKNVKGVVYRAKPGATKRGNHIRLIVGYDDNAKCWIVKNS
ncbi:MAG: hypothetical protein K2W96_19665 [Gemmataceae bacterium]|nr:hypothetical protein [Gemmataceae bacterium]